MTTGLRHTLAQLGWYNAVLYWLGRVLERASGGLRQHKRRAALTIIIERPAKCFDHRGPRSSTGPSDMAQLIHELIFQTAQRLPQRAALSYQGHSLSYDAFANCVRVASKGTSISST